MPRAKSQAILDREIGTWNAEVSIGAPVNYRKDDGGTLETHTRSEAWVLGGHTAVVMVEQVRGCVALDRISLRGDQ